MLVSMRHEYHDEFHALGEALGCPRAQFPDGFSAREDFGPEVTGRGKESPQKAS